MNGCRADYFRTTSVAQTHCCKKGIYFQCQGNEVFTRPD